MTGWEVVGEAARRARVLIAGEGKVVNNNKSESPKKEKRGMPTKKKSVHFFSGRAGGAGSAASNAPNRMPRLCCSPPSCHSPPRGAPRALPRRPHGRGPTLQAFPSPLFASPPSDRIFSWVRSRLKSGILVFPGFAVPAAPIARGRVSSFPASSPRRS